MAQRLDLQALLIDLLGSGNVYFQPPESIRMSYPAIVYKRDNQDTKYADNAPYLQKIAYQVTVIDADPDSIIPKNISMLPLCSFERFFVSDNLNHDVYRLFF